LFDYTSRLAQGLPFGPVIDSKIVVLIAANYAGRIPNMTFSNSEHQSYRKDGIIAVRLL